MQSKAKSNNKTFLIKELWHETYREHVMEAA